MPSVDSANMPPKSHDVGLSTPMTTMKPTEPSTMTSGSRRISGDEGVARGISGGASRWTSPEGTSGGARRAARRKTRVPTGDPPFHRSHHPSPASGHTREPRPAPGPFGEPHRHP